MRTSGSSATRQRLIDATLELVAERGFDGTSVGAIETRAGLAPRSGALYQYFDSKLAVLQAGLEHHLNAIDDIEMALDAAVNVEVGSEAETIARWLLDELDREQVVTQVIEREGERLPDLRDRMRNEITERGFRIAASLIDRWGIQRIGDADCLAILMVGALVNVRRSTWTFGAPPLGIDDGPIIVTFRSLVTALAGHDRNRES